MGVVVDQRAPGPPDRPRSPLTKLSPAGVAAVLLGAALVAWIVTVDRMRGMDAGPGTDLGGLGWFLGIWVTMMAAMMLPSAAPMVLVFAGMSRARAERGHVHGTRVLKVAQEKAEAALAESLGLRRGARVFHSVLVHLENGIPIQYEDRYVIPTTHREYAENAFDLKSSCGFSFGQGCYDGRTVGNLFSAAGPSAGRMAPPRIREAEEAKKEAAK